MNKFLKQLVDASYKNDILDATIVELIGSKLSRRELKRYIYALKSSEKKRTLVVEVPNTKSRLDQASLEKIFGKKQIQYIENPDLIVGVRITDNDNVYNMNLQNNLERMKTYAGE